MIRRAWIPALLLLLPVLWVATVKDRVLARESFDLVGHLWTLWNASLGDPTRSTMQAWPQGVDLLPIVGGWGDILLGAPLVRPLGLQAAYNVVAGLYVFLTGVGGYVLARVLGAGRGGAVTAGLLFQVDGFVLSHLMGGRPEQVALGVVALALAGAIHTWRTPGWRAVIGTGVAGAATVYVSWEFPIVLAAAVVFLVPFLWKTRCKGTFQRWGAALGVAVVLAGPWALAFAIRAAAVRSADEGQRLSEFVIPASVGLLSWFTMPFGARPAWPVLASLLVLPWTTRDRRLWVGIGVGLLLSLALALGPSPGLWMPGDLRWNYGLYQLFIKVPFLSWFHTPDRLLCTWDLAAPVAAALSVTALARKRRWLALSWAALLLGTSVGVALWADCWPRGRYHVNQSVPLERLRDAPGEGVVLDVPIQTQRLRVMSYVESQLAHRRPIPHHAAIPPLFVDAVTDLAGQKRFFAWFRAATNEGASTPLTAADLVELRQAGYRFLVVHPNFIRARPRGDEVLKAITEIAGKPFCFEPDRWYAWDLGG